MKEQQIAQLKKQLEICHNMILTGAPGTGKTYLARQIAAQMVLGKDVVDIDYLTDDEKNIIKKRTTFVQFHSSYDYTDFVEGLRPDYVNGGEIKFKRRDGVFKVFCKQSLLIEPAVNDIIEDNKIEPTADDIKEEYAIARDKIVNGELSFLMTEQKTPKATFISIANPENWGLTTGKDRTPRKEGNIAERGDIAYPKSVIKLYSAGFRSFENPGDKSGHNGNDTDIRTILNYLYFEARKRLNSTLGNGERPFVFIIDEINRGELSKIFGELFFSIDPGYRGEKGRVSTQYQNLIEKDDTDPFKDGFYVPENVYIIGTMNDIDRSIESMDFAIRRRFAWVEVKANENTEMLSKLGNTKKKAIDVMKALNKAIWNEDSNSGIEGLSSAYHIGASYFLKLDDYKDSDNPFKELWDYHLKGLLTEYLRGMDDAGKKLADLKKAYDDAVAANG